MPTGCASHTEFLPYPRHLGAARASHPDRRRAAELAFAEAMRLGRHRARRGRRTRAATRVVIRRLAARRRRAHGPRVRRTTTSSRSIRSMNGLRRRSSRSSRDIGCRRGAAGRQGPDPPPPDCAAAAMPRDAAVRCPSTCGIVFEGERGVELRSTSMPGWRPIAQRLAADRRASSATAASSRATCPRITTGLRGIDVRPDRCPG